ncbi:MAG: ilvB, partial [Acidimicrobiales bacterium]|nr:ilvB [Acidimicrobiales bacterium]
MNGAQALIRTLVERGVDVCFMNPGTSEMHFVAALDDVPEMRGVLALFEGVATGAADGYARMADHPAATLLHLGPGLGNGLANLHNARKAHTPVVNIVGDHATYHKQYDAQLESDIETVAHNVSPGFVRSSAKTAELGRDAADAVDAATEPPGQVATLILSADVSWGEGGEPAPQRSERPRRAVDTERVRAIAELLQGGEPVGLFIGGRACRADALRAVT